jgi:hypothetical protein
MTSLATVMREAKAKARAARAVVRDAVKAADAAVAGFWCDPVDS